MTPRGSQPARFTPAAFAGVLALVLGSATPAAAIPAFARRYNTSCTSCHQGAFPALNPYGRLIKEQGFQLPEGAEEPVREERTLSPGTIAERLAVLTELPVSLRASGSAVVPVDPLGTGRNPLDLKALEGLQLVAGAAIFRNVSFFAAAELAPTPQLHHGAVGVHNLFGEGVLHLRAGKFLLMDFVRPEHRDIGGLPNPAAAVKVGLNPTSLDNSHLGVQAFGRLFGQRLFYGAALVQGAQQQGGVADLDAHKDGFGQLQYVGDKGTVGVFGYRGRTQLVDSAQGARVRFTDDFWIAGADAEVTLGELNLFGYALAARHRNPTGWREPVDYSAARGELSVLLRQDALAVVRFDGVFAKAPGLAKQTLTCQLTYLALTNLKLSALYLSTWHDLRQSSVQLRLDLAI